MLVRNAFVESINVGRRRTVRTVLGQFKTVLTARVQVHRIRLVRFLEKIAQQLLVDQTLMLQINALRTNRTLSITSILLHDKLIGYTLRKLEDPFSLYIPFRWFCISINSDGTIFGGWILMMNCWPIWRENFTDSNIDVNPALNKQKAHRLNDLVDLVEWQSKVWSWFANYAELSNPFVIQKLVDNLILNGQTINRFVKEREGRKKKEN